MDRRLFLKLSGLLAAASAFEALPVAAEGSPSAMPSERTLAQPPAAATVAPRVAIREPGMYQITGFVRVEDSLVEISGITNCQTISRSGLDAGSRLVSFTTFEQIDRPGLTPLIQVQGGRLESLAATPIILE